MPLAPPMLPSPRTDALGRSMRWRTKLTTAVEQFITERKIRLTPATIAAYQSDLRGLLAKLTLTGKQDSVMHFSADLARAYLLDQSSQNKSMATLHRKQSVLREFGKWGARRRFWSVDPTVELESIRKPKRLPRPFSKDESQRLFALDLSRQQVVLRAVLFFTGLRVTEIAGLKVGDVSANPPEIRVIAKGRRPRVIKLHAGLKDLLWDYLANHTDMKATTPLWRVEKGRAKITRKTIEDWTAAWGRAANIIGCTPHRFRHTFGTKLLEQTGDLRLVQEAMGHADIQSTVAYTELASDRVQRAIDQLRYE